MSKRPVPPLPAAAKKMFAAALNAQNARIANGTEPSGRTDVGGSYHIPVHNSGAGRPNFPSGGGV